MGDHDITPTCLTDRQHGPEDVLDKLLHYTGCIEFSQRNSFLRPKHDVWQSERTLLLDSRRNGKPGPITHDADLEDQKWANEQVTSKIQAFAGSVFAQWHRINLLRSAIGQKPPNDQQTGRQSADAKDTSHLVRCVEDSLRNWRQSREYKDGIKTVRQWRSKTGKVIDGPHSWDEDEVAFVQARMSQEKRMSHERRTSRDSRAHLQINTARDTAEVDEYDLERDLNGYIIQFEYSAAGPPTSQVTGSSLGGRGSLSLSTGSLLTGHVTSQRPGFFKSADSTCSKVKGHFPDQRVSLSQMLDDTDAEILNNEQEGERIKYFHIPCNNREYAERIISNYFRDERPKYDGIFRNPAVKTKSHMILQPGFWSGQQHGGRSDVVHARHMRPLCEVVSSATDEAEPENTPNNLVLFMPYIHWETDRNRDRISRVIGEETQKKRKRKSQVEISDKKERQTHRDDLKWPASKKTRHPKEQLLFDDDQNESRMTETHENAADGLWEGVKQAKSSPQKKKLLFRLFSSRRPTQESPIPIQRGKHGRLLPRSPLGQYLIDVARLYEAMLIFRDQKLLEKYLNHDPPLHPRRTLDQAYYWTLKSTKTRDRDQVVYRSTTMEHEYAHHFRDHGESPCCEVKDKNGQVSPRTSQELARQNGATMTGVSIDGCEPVAETHPDSKPGKQGQTSRRWTGHFNVQDENGCEQCRSDIRKVSRVVMVDQLWMWILDEKTIITCFPRRYGVNKQDPSGVHKSIRQRLGQARKNQIKSVYDLALIILDECSNTFFDRTKTRDRQPQVMDIFSEAIGKVTHKQSILFDRLWHWTDEASKMYRNRKHHIDPTEFHAPLLDISPEGRLQREIKDIIDELDIMLYINKKQQDVLKRFVKKVDFIMDEDGHMRKMLSPAAASWEDDSSPPELTRKISLKEETQSAHDSRRHDEFDWFRRKAKELLSEVKYRIEELEGLHTSAESTAKSVTDLLGLKQQQASVVQAWQSVKQGEETVRQGRSIMMFTLVTIVFLPLAFMSSIFGMNNETFSPSNDPPPSPGNQDAPKPMTLEDQIKWMVVVAFLVILFSVTIAFRGFSKIVRDLVWSVSAYGITWALVRLGVYRLWLEVSEALASDEVVSRTEVLVEDLKRGVRRARQEKKRDHMISGAKKARLETLAREALLEKGEDGANGSVRERLGTAASDGGRSGRPADAVSVPTPSLVSYFSAPQMGTTMSSGPHRASLERMRTAPARSTQGTLGPLDEGLEMLPTASGVRVGRLPSRGDGSSLGGTIVGEPDMM